MIEVFTAPSTPSHAVLKVGYRSVSARIGRAGVVTLKREGDGGTPRGRLCAVRGWWRADRRPRPRTLLPMAPLRPDLGWCDAPGHRLYNRAVRLPFAASHERMTREDRLYDVVVELDWNRSPRVAGRGSAIFLHVAPEDGGPTAGCIALSPRDLDLVLARLRRGSMIRVR